MPLRPLGGDVEVEDAVLALGLALDPAVGKGGRICLASAFANGVAIVGTTVFLRPAVTRICSGIPRRPCVSSLRTSLVRHQVTQC